MLNKTELEDALSGIAAIPQTVSLENRVTFGLTINNYDDWPFKIVYSSDGIDGNTLLGHLFAYYSEHPEISLGRRPNIIHVAGKYAIFRIVTGMSILNYEEGGMITPPAGTFRLFTRDSDLQAIVWALDGLQQRATASTHILYDYQEMLNEANSPANA
jgi:hypothetical protein